MARGHAYFSGGGRVDEDTTNPVDYFIGGD